jgi:eukaryotic-like serine/threonine-protein kinase
MTLAPGTRIGPYQVTALLGEGGMGKVWRAHHTGLKRDDALKVLPDAFASDPDRLARFQREAQVLASLNHPNIAHVYGLEKADGVQALVMELVEGPTLADRIAKGPIPVDEALPIARQIAEALEVAHEQGIIHRDLKPANIKVRSDGTVKVLDFGLAKALEPAFANGIDVTASPTITSPAMMTGVGVLLGTAAYMSPEQARGKAVDKRADIWAFGCVVYEMLTGKRAFEGNEVSDVLASVLAREPDWTALPPGLPPVLVTFLKRCLHKDLKQRIGDLQSVRLALEGVFGSGASQDIETAVCRPRWRRAVPYAVGAFVATIVLGVAAGSLWPAADPRPVNRFANDIPSTLVFRSTARSVMAMAPDGRTVVYNTSQGFYLHALDELDGRMIPGTDGDLFNPVFSPDGQFIGYWDGRKASLMRIGINGGAPVAIAPIGLPEGLSWAATGTIFFGRPQGIMAVPSTGGMPTLVIKANESERLDSPQLLPDGDSVLFTVTTATGDTRWDQAEIMVQSLRTGSRTLVLEGGSDARYLSTGHLIYARGNTLFSAVFDIERLAVSGEAVPVAEGLRRTNTPGSDSAAANYDVSNEGTLVFLTGGASADRRSLVWVDRQGREQPLSAPPRAYVYPRISPDGTRVALRVRDQQRDIWIWDFERETLTRITFSPGEELYPVWTTDGQRLLFDAPGGDGLPSVFWQAADGTGTAEQLSDSRNRPRPFSLTPDGNGVVLRVGSAPPYDLALLLLGSTRRTEPLLTTPFNETNAEISPDGRWMVYESDESGRSEVYVRPFPNVQGGRWQVSRERGTRPSWSRNGRELFYLARDGGNTILIRVSVEAGKTWIAGTPTELFTGRFFADDAPNGPGQGRTYDVSPDGQRFLMLKEGDGSGNDAPVRRLVVVQNWFEELKRLVPTN